MLLPPAAEHCPSVASSPFTFQTPFHQRFLVKRKPSVDLLTVLEASNLARGLF